MEWGLGLTISPASIRTDHRWWIARADITEKRFKIFGG